MSSLDARSFVRKGNTLVPADIHADEFLAGIPDGKEVLATIRRPRSPEHNRWFFAMLAKVCHASGKFNDPEELLDAIKFVVGHVETRQQLDGTIIKRPKSISFAMMDEEAFKRFTKRATWAINEYLHIDADALMAEVDAEQGDVLGRHGGATHNAPEAAASEPAPPGPDAPAASIQGSEAALQPAAPVAAAGSDRNSPKAIPPEDATAPAAGAALTPKDRDLLRRYASHLGEALRPVQLAKGSAAFRKDFGIKDKTPIGAAADAILQAHLDRVEGESSPAETDAAIARILGS